MMEKNNKQSDEKSDKDFRTSEESTSSEKNAEEMICHYSGLSSVLSYESN